MPSKDIWFIIWPMKTDKKDTQPESPLKQKFVARQPIFDRKRKVVGYELLFRAGFANVFNDYWSADNASSQTLLDSFLLFGINELTGGKQAFINFTRNILLSNVASIFSNDSLVIELLETIEPDSDIIAACKKLKQSGYRMALDDFTFDLDLKPLIDFMDIIKVDFLETKGEKRRQVFESLGITNHKKHIKLLAEKIETHEDFNLAMDMGYDYFQGYFFSKPVVVARKDIPSVKLNLLRLLGKIYQPEIDLYEVETVIKQDVSLAYKLIRFINSPNFGLTVEVQSIMHVLNLLGIKEVRKWVSLLALSQLSQDEPEELVVESVVRARFCELIAEHTGKKEKSAEFFLMGLFSLIDVFFERPMSEILKELPLSREIKDALIDGTGLMGDVLHFAKSYQIGDWDTIFKLSSQIKLDEEIIPELYFDTVVWANALNLNQ